IETVSQGYFVQRNLIFAGSGESYLIGRVHRMPKGPRKLVITFGNQTLTHYGGVYLLHRFLTRIGLKNAIATEIRFYPTEQSLHCRGIAACHPLPNHSWSRTNRNNTVVATQWCLPVPERTADLPRPQHQQTCLSSHGTPGS